MERIADLELELVKEAHEQLVQARQDLEHAQGAFQFLVNRIYRVYELSPDVDSVDMNTGEIKRKRSQ